MKAWIALLTCAVALQASALAQEGEAQYLTGLEWETRPNAQHIAAAFPNRALAREQSGGATLDCLINEDRMLTCDVTHEEPIGWGFGEAALRVAQRFLAPAVAPDGTRTVGRRVLVPIVFRLAESTLPPDVDVDAMALTLALHRSYPRAARAAGISGQVSLDCAVAEEQRFACAIAEESPEGHGFGAASLEVMRGPAIRPRHDAEVGAQTRITLRYTPPPFY